MVVYVDTHLKQVSTTGNHTTGKGVGASGFYKNVVKTLICGTEVLLEVLGTGDGVGGVGTLVFGGTLAHFPVGLRRLIVHYTILGTPYTAADDGSGVITGTYCNGTLTHSSGVWTLTFDAGKAPDNLVNITGDYLYGNPGADWRIMYERKSRTPAGADESYGEACKETVLHNTGLSGTENVYIGIREHDYVSGGGLGWDLNGYATYSATSWNVNGALTGLTSYGSTWKHYTQHPVMPMSNSSFTYWIWSNQQRIIVVIFANTHYLSMYLGYGRRFGQITNYPCPMVVKGMTYGDALFTGSPTPAYQRFIADCGTYALTNTAQATGSGTTMYSLFCVGPDNSYIVNGLSNAAVQIFPRRQFYWSGPEIVSRTMTALRTPAKPCYLVKFQSSGDYVPEKLLVDLDGVYWIFGDPLAAQDIVSFNTERHIAFPDSNRSAWYDFMAITDKYITTTT